MKPRSIAVALCTLVHFPAFANVAAPALDDAAYHNSPARFEGLGGHDLRSEFRKGLSASAIAEIAATSGRVTEYAWSDLPRRLEEIAKDGPNLAVKLERLAAELRRAKLTGFDVHLSGPYLYSVILRVRDGKPADAAKILRGAAQAARAYHADRHHGFDPRLFAQQSHLVDMMANYYSPGELERLRDPKGRTERYDWSKLPDKVERVADLLASTSGLPLSRQRATTRYLEGLNALRAELHRAIIDERFDPTAQALYTDVMRAWHDMQRASKAKGPHRLAWPGAHLRDQAGYTAHTLYSVAALARMHEDLGNGKQGGLYFEANDGNLRDDNVLRFGKPSARRTPAFQRLEHEQHAQFVRLKAMETRAHSEAMAKVKARYGNFHF